MMTNEHVTNMGLSILDTIFKEKGWQLIKNELNWICYTIPGDETTYFDIRILPNKIVVSVPIKNSSYQYITEFNNYCEAHNYIEQKIIDYIK
jgi:hypothetical protein